MAKKVQTKKTERKAPISEKFVNSVLSKDNVNAKKYLKKML